MAGGQGDVSKAAFLTAEEREKSVVITDPSQPDNPMIYVSEEFETQTGYTPKEALHRNCRFLQGAETNQGTVQAIRDALRQQISITVDILNYRKDGSKFWNRLRIRPIYDDNGVMMYYAGVQNPIAADQVTEVPSEAIKD